MATDNFAESIIGRKRQIREQFSESLARVLDERGISQSMLSKGVEEIFRRDNVMAKPGKGGKVEIRKAPAWEISRWARGQVTPDPVAIAAIAETVGVQPDDLVHHISADVDPNALVSSYKQVGNKFFWEMKGTVSAATHRALMRVLAEETIHAGQTDTVICEATGKTIPLADAELDHRADGTIGAVSSEHNRTR